MVNDLIFVKPEEEGLDSKQVLKFINIIEECKINLHSFMIVRKGKILAEGYYPPFHKDFMHRLYSASKTYVSMAVGKLMGEGKVKLTDRLVDYFPELLDRQQDKWMQETTIEDALKMSVPMLTDTYFDRKYKEWAWTFFNRQESLKPAGTVFNYNTSGSFILDVLVEKLTGMTFLEYLRPEFDKIGISKDIWCVKSPDGYSWGGSGVVCTMRDFAKFAELIMYKGEYKGEQLLPRAYIKKATTKQIENVVENNYALFKSGGYGYQIWIQKAGFSLYGMGSQFALCFPDKELLFVCNGDTQCSADSAGNDIYNAVYEKIYLELQEKRIENDGTAYQQLKEKLTHLHLSLDFGEKTSPLEKEIDGKKYVLQENPMGWKWLQFTFEGGRCALKYENARGIKVLPFAMETYKQCTFPETHYYDRQVDMPANRELDCLTSASWTMPNQLLLRVYIVDTNFGNCFMTFGFKNDEVGVYMYKRAEFFMQEYEGYAGGKRNL